MVKGMDKGAWIVASVQVYVANDLHNWPPPLSNRSFFPSRDHCQKNIS
jgi:hypothetical protein